MTNVCYKVRIVRYKLAMARNKLLILTFFSQNCMFISRILTL